MTHSAIVRSEVPFFVSAPRATFGQVLYRPGAFLGPRVQQDFQLVLVYEGLATIFVDDVEHRIAAGYVGLLHPGHTEFIRFSPVESTSHSWCALKPEAISDAMKSPLAHCAVCCPISDRLQTLIDLGLGLPDDIGTTCDLAIEALASAAMGAYVLHATLRTEKSLLPEVVERAKRLIETDLARDWTLTTLAQEVCVTPTYLVTLCKQHLGITPARYLWSVRTRRGVQLLLETGLTVGEVAHRVGFRSPFHFSRLVKQQYGVSPRHLRDRIWQKQE